MPTEARKINRPSSRVRTRHRGANLAILCCVAAMIVAFMGISIYTGLQAYLQNEIQKAATTSAMSGAAVYYSSPGPQGKPAPNQGAAIAAATSTFNSITQNSRALKGFGIALNGPITSNDNNDSITVNARGSMGTPFLAPIGINSITMDGAGTARALKYEPTNFIGPVSIIPTDDIGSFQRVVELDFPMVDGPGTDLYVEQLAQQPYDIEACNPDMCYDLEPGASPVGTSRKVDVPGAGTRLMLGTFTIDLGAAKVNKATQLRITHGNIFTSFYAGQDQILQVYPTPLNVDRIMIFGYAGVCPNKDNCPIPAGFSPVE